MIFPMISLTIHKKIYYKVIVSTRSVETRWLARVAVFSWFIETTLAGWVLALSVCA